jgi:hypothetical protein
LEGQPGRFDWRGRSRAGAGTGTREAHAAAFRSGMARKWRVRPEVLAGLGDLRPGSLSTQYNVCGSPNCKCKADPPQKHGPYYQVSFTRKGKGSTKFVKEENLTIIREQLKNYERMKELVDRWIELSMELSNLRLAHPKV